jgi:hypothetical protein
MVTVMVTVRNGERSGTVNGQKRLQNHVPGTFTFTLQKRENHCPTNIQTYHKIFHFFLI